MPHELNEGITVDLTYDIFRRLPDGAAVWIEAVQNLEHARRRLLDLMNIEPGNYMVYDLSHSRVVAEGPSSS